MIALDILILVGAILAFGVLALLVVHLIAAALFYSGALVHKGRANYYRGKR